MATLYISYYATVDKEVSGDPIASETVTTSATSAASGTIPTGAIVAKLVSDTAHYYTIGTGTPTATATNGAYIGANQPEWTRISGVGRAALKFAAITA